MPRLPKPTFVVIAVLCSLIAAACGAQSDAAPRAESAGLRACQAQWADVANTVVDMDRDPSPSALSSRWTSVMAGISYQTQNTQEKTCVEAIDAQVREIDALRKFMTRLRPYDMTYQLQQLGPKVDVYLDEPLPAPTPGDSGKTVSPPTKAQVRNAFTILTNNAELANQELQAGWGQADTTDLTDPVVLRRTMRDLDFLASRGSYFQLCEESLQVLVAAVTAQQSQ